VQVRHSRDRVSFVVQCRKEIQQVFAISADLFDRMKCRMMAVAVNRHQPRVVFVQVGAAPLLELDHDE